MNPHLYIDTTHRVGRGLTVVAWAAVFASAAAFVGSVLTAHVMPSWFWSDGLLLVGSVLVGWTAVFGYVVVSARCDRRFSSVPRSGANAHDRVGTKGIPGVLPGAGVITADSPSWPPDPSDQTRQLVEGAWRLQPYRDLAVPRGPWQLGLALHRGPVRQHNEDYALAFTIDDTVVSIIADGCGGIPHGQHAAYAGAVGAAVSVIRQLAWLPLELQPPVLEHVALRAVRDAADCVADHARRLGIDATRGMRSTLVVTLTTSKHVHYAHIGDGGGFILRAGDHRVESFIEPQKAGSYLNVLAASLGATLQGEPRYGHIPCNPGDLIWVCSDGIADRTDPQHLGPELLQATLTAGGDLNAVATAFLDRFAAWEDEHGHVFDDNMSLILTPAPGSAPGSPGSPAPESHPGNSTSGNITEDFDISDIDDLGEAFDDLALRDQSIHKLEEIASASAETSA